MGFIKRNVQQMKEIYKYSTTNDCRIQQKKLFWSEETNDVALIKTNQTNCLDTADLVKCTIYQIHEILLRLKSVVATE